MQGLSSLQTFPNTPQLLLSSLEDWNKGSKLELAWLFLKTPGDSFSTDKAPSRSMPGLATSAIDAVPKELSMNGIFWFPSKFFSDLQAKAWRFTGRSDLIILSKKMAGKLNLGITLTSYDREVVEDLWNA